MCLNYKNVQNGIKWRPRAIRNGKQTVKQMLHASRLIFAARIDRRKIERTSYFVKEKNVPATTKKKTKKNTTNSDSEENRHFSSPKYILRRYGVITM